jgi:hypothetical protein
MLTWVCFGWVLHAASGAGASAVAVRGSTTCPTARDVTAALAGMLPRPNADLAPDVVDLNAQDKSIIVRLISAAGELIAEKRLPDSLSCAERARTTAVIVAAWEVRLHAETQPNLSVPTAALTPTSASAAATISRAASGSASASGPAGPHRLRSRHRHGNRRAQRPCGSAPPSRTQLLFRPSR